MQQTKICSDPMFFAVVFVRLPSKGVVSLRLTSSVDAPAAIPQIVPRFA